MQTLISAVCRGRRMLCAAAFLSFALSSGRARAAPDVVIDGAGIYPESLTSLADGTLYVGSVKGTLYRALPGSTRAEPWIVRDAHNGLLSIFGVLADARSRALWVCSSPVPLPGGVTGGTASLKRFALATGAETGSWPLPAAHAICDDIAIAPDGTAFIGDIATGEILTLAPHAKSLRVFARHPSLVGIDGITFAQDGTLYVDNVRKSQLLRVDRSSQGRFAGLTVLTTSVPIGGPDGLRLIAGHRFVLAEGRNGRIDEVAVSGDRAVIRVLRGGLMSPTAATVVGDTVYAVEGKIEYVIDPALKNKDPGPFVVHAIPLLH